MAAMENIENNSGKIKQIIKGDIEQFIGIQGKICPVCRLPSYSKI